MEGWEDPVAAWLEAAGAAVTLLTPWGAADTLLTPWGAAVTAGLLDELCCQPWIMRISFPQCCVSSSYTQCCLFLSCTHRSSSCLLSSFLQPLSVYVSPSSTLPADDHWVLLPCLLLQRGGASSHTGCVDSRQVSFNLSAAGLEATEISPSREERCACFSGLITGTPKYIFFG